jgi:hypothetical protein
MKRFISISIGSRAGGEITMARRCLDDPCQKSGLDCDVKRGLER